MAAGMPVIATRAVSAARFFVRPEVSGLLVRPDAASIHRALVRFVEEPQVLTRMGAEARHAAHAGTAEFIADLYARAALRELARAREA
jgi:glycosyltransferase involved in cell wall biosynthesis